MELNQKILKFIINKDATLIEAMKQMDLLDKKSLLVFNQNKFINIITIGDIQRAILKSFDLKSSIFNILRENTKIATNDMSFDEIKKLMKDFRIELMPVISPMRELVKVYFWEDIFN